MFLQLVTYLVVGLLLAVMLDVSSEIRGDNPLLCIIIIQLALPLVFLLTTRLQMLFVLSEPMRTSALTEAALIFLLVKSLRGKSKT